MHKYLDMDAIINKMRNNIQQISFSEDFATTLKVSDQIDIRRILEVLNVTNDVKLQTKLFSILSACLILNRDSNFELIIKYTAVYDRINNVLVKGLPQKAVHALNFLSTILYVDVEDDGPTKRRTLALYAKNMTRISGCLGTMSDMFTNCMMYHDTWNALCQCLAAACGGSDLNQSYCSHLVPVCIQRCNQTNIEIFSVLQSLLLNHNRNMELFLNCNGILIFTRELLHYDKCIQVLITVVQHPSASSLLLRQTQVLNDLREFLRLYGHNSQIGQKAMIILNHIELRSRGSQTLMNQASKENSSIIIESNKDKYAQMRENKGNDDLNDTTLMQNIMKEVYNFKQNQQREKMKTAFWKKATPKPNLNSLIRSTNSTLISFRKQRNNKDVHVTDTPNKTRNVMVQEQREREKLQYNNKAELTFSFLHHNYSLSTRKRHTKAVDKSKIVNNKMSVIETKTPKIQPFQNDLYYPRKLNSTEYYRTITNKQHTSTDTIDFKPKFSSTLNHEESSNPDSKSTTPHRKSSFPAQSQTLLRRRKVGKRKPETVAHNNDKNLRNKSLSYRFLRAINESCTTLLKTVTNIFKKNETLDSSKDRTETHKSQEDTKYTQERTCSFSFLNYMQKRDAIFNKLPKTRKRDDTEFSLETESCKTCDTQALKNKMAKNAHLKKTVKKLKMGINLYGCDFKKISKAMWPLQPYMTPIVLYNLYRKLLLK